jgi:hypothetical protein
MTRWIRAACALLLAAIPSRCSMPSIILLAFAADCDKNTTVELRLQARALTASVSSRNNAHGAHP